MKYVTKPSNCDGTGMVSMPVAHIVLRRCQTGDNFYYTVDADPHQNCPKHSSDEDYSDG